MVWTGTKALVAGIIAEIVLRAIALFVVLRGTVLLNFAREKNSKTWLKKLKETVSPFQWFTLLCVWDVNYEKPHRARAFICLYNWMLWTLLLPLGAMLLSFVTPLPIEIARVLFRWHFYLDLIVLFPVNIYILRKFNS